MPSTSVTSPMQIPPVAARPEDGAQALKITPTDVSQFVRFESCERFLRLQLHARNVEYRFLDAWGLRAQPLSPLLARSGADFEERLEGALLARDSSTLDLSVEGEWEFADRMPEGQAESGGRAEEAVQFAARSESGDRRRKPDNERVLAAARSLEPGRTIWLLQPRLAVPVGGWEMRGDVDVLRLRRDKDGRLQVLLADMKASPSPKVDQKLQVAFYHEMLRALFEEAGLDHEPIACGVLYRGPLDLSSVTDSEAAQLLESHRLHARREFGELEPAPDGSPHAYFDPMDDREAYLAEARSLVFDEASTARRIADKEYGALDWYLSAKCDGCPFSEWCLSSAAQDDDLSLLPYMEPEVKSALRAQGVLTVPELAALKSLRSDGDIQVAARADAGVPSSTSTSTWEGEEEASAAPDPQAWNELETALEHRELVRRLSSTRKLGARLDELILRSHALLRKRGGAFAELRAKKRLARRGHPSLPFSSPALNPNLVTLYIDAQYDFLNDRLYGLGALVVAHEQGVAKEPRCVVKLAEGPPASDEVERRLLQEWVAETLRAVVESASPTAEGVMEAPIHLVFYDSREQRELLEALGRHFESIREATPLYDFVTQISSFDSSLASFLDQEMRERRNYPLTCPSVYEAASWLRFDWGSPLPFRDLFRERLFDGGGYLELEGGTEDEARQWVQRRARYGSSIPLEYAHAAWGLLPPAPPSAREDAWEPFRRVGREEWLAFAQRRLEAIRHVAADFEGNKLTEKRPFVLPDLGEAPSAGASLADALEEFLMIERHATVGTWQAARNAPPERRALAGDSLVCRYFEEDQDDPEALAQNRLNALIEGRRQEWRDANPEAKSLPRGFDASLGLGSRDYEIALRLRLEAERSEVPAEEMLALSGFAQGQRVIVAPRYSSDGRLPPHERRPFQTTARQILYGMRASLEAIELEPEGPQSDDGSLRRAWLRLRFTARGGTDKKGFTFSGSLAALREGERFTIEEEVSDYVGSHALATLHGLRRFHARNALLERLQRPESANVHQGEEARLAQARFLDGLQVLAQGDPRLEMEESKRDFIGGHGGAPFLLVQGPPGTGKTYASSWALLARLQGAMADERELRVLVSCKTHSAIDVLLRGLERARARLRRALEEQPEVFAKYFDERLLLVPILRYEPKDAASWRGDPANEGLHLLVEKGSIAALQPGQERADKYLERLSFCVLGATPNACYKMCAQTSSKGGDEKARALFGHQWFGALVVDEASQMSLPEAVMSALALEESAPVIVVGDPRQMPPIVAHDWRNETRRTFARFKAFVSLYDAISSLDPPRLQVLAQVLEAPQGLVTHESHQVLESGERGISIPRVRFEESFRLHRDMAEFLRREIYRHDGIAYHSRRTEALDAPRAEHADPFVRAVLDPRHPLVVVVHEEEGSVLSNEFEHELARPILEALSQEAGHGLDPRSGLGIVVPHRAQRALMSSARWNVDTVERFQGDEREAMLFCATESERGHLLRAGGFLFDPRRLNVALSRARRKMILLASRTLFEGFFADPETFANALLWKNLLRHTCTVPLYDGRLQGVRFEVRGNDPEWKTM